MNTFKITLITGLFVSLAIQISLAQPRAAALVSADYTGTYRYHNATTLQLLPKDTLLLAIIDESMYPLRQAGPDRFINQLGDTIPFQRNQLGQVISFQERGISFARFSTTTRFPVEALYARRLASGVPVSYTYQPPSLRQDGLAVASLPQVGLPVEPFQQMIQAIINEQYPNVHSVLIWKDGKLALEEYFYGYHPKKLHQLRSATKSFVSALIGIATDQGLFKSEQDRLLPYLPYTLVQNLDARKKGWTIKDFLTMRTGLDCDDNNEQSAGYEEKMYQQADWVKFIVNLPLVDQPGTKGSYCSGAVIVLGKALENRARQSLPLFAQTNLFAPLGITQFKWNYLLTNANPTVAQLNLSSRDMLKFGILYLSKGQWQGKQIISPAWIEKSLGTYSRLGSKLYGYFWWHQRFTQHGRSIDAWLATGNGGQKIFIFPAYQLVAVFTGGNYNSTTDTPPNELVPKFILTALTGHP